jgi:hypothetical protein
MKEFFYELKKTNLIEEIRKKEKLVEYYFYKLIKYDFENGMELNKELLKKLMEIKNLKTFELIKEESGDTYILFKIKHEINIENKDIIETSIPFEKEVFNLNEIKYLEEIAKLINLSIREKVEFKDFENVMKIFEFAKDKKNISRYKNNMFYKFKEYIDLLYLPVKNLIWKNKRKKYYLKYYLEEQDFSKISNKLDNLKLDNINYNIRKKFIKNDNQNFKNRISLKIIIEWFEKKYFDLFINKDKTKYDSIYQYKMYIEFYSKDLKSINKIYSIKTALNKNNLLEKSQFTNRFIFIKNQL